MLPTLLGHLKLHKLVKRLGITRAEAIGHMFILEVYAGLQRPNGIFRGLTAEDIEIAAEWTGKDGMFCSAMVDVGFLDFDGSGTYRWHDFADWRADWITKRAKRQDAYGRAADTGSRAADGSCRTATDGSRAAAVFPSEQNRTEQTREGSGQTMEGSEKNRSAATVSLSQIHNSSQSAEREGAAEGTAGVLEQRLTVAADLRSAEQDQIANMTEAECAERRKQIAAIIGDATAAVGTTRPTYVATHDSTGFKLMRSALEAVGCDRAFLDALARQPGLSPELIEDAIRSLKKQTEPIKKPGAWLRVWFREAGLKL